MTETDFLNLLCEAHRQIGRLEAKLLESRGSPNWISVRKMEPELETTVLCLLVNSQVRLMWLSNNNRWYDRDETIDFSAVTHWMPLPQPLKE